MINNVTLLGRITHDLEVKNTQSGVCVLTFTVAVDRNYTKQNEEKQVDFIRCVAWKQRATFINQYFKKGNMIAIEGRLQTRTYDDKNGVKHYITEVIVTNVSFTGERQHDVVKDSALNDEKLNCGEPTNDNIIGSIDDYEVVISDEGVPF